MLTATKKLDLATVTLPHTWRAAPDAQTIIMRIPSAPAELRRAPRHTPVPAPAPEAPLAQVVATAQKERPRPEVFALIRRVALQRDLVNAVGVLHAELGELVRARIVLAVATGGGISSPLPADLREAAPMVPLAAIDVCAKRNQPVTGERVVMIPIDLGVPAVLVACRPPTAPAFEPENVFLIAGIAGRLAMLDHFFAADAEKKQQALDDHKSMFRPEALAAARDGRGEGDLVGLSPRWVRLAVPVILAIAVALIVAAALVQVPTYSRGTVVVQMNGTNVIANSSGRIAKVLVTQGQDVKAGDPLIQLDTQKEQQDFDQIDGTYRDQLSQFLFDPTDEPARQSLAGIFNQRKAVESALAAKTIVAPIDGEVSAVLAADIVNAGEHVITIVPAGAAPTITAYMPGGDLTRFYKGMTIRVSPHGYDAHLDLIVDEVAHEAIGQGNARKLIGQKLADSVVLPQTIVIVKAKLPGGSFESAGKTYSFFDGMDGEGEIEVDTKSFLSVVIPTGE